MLYFKGKSYITVGLNNQCYVIMEVLPDAIEDPETGNSDVKNDETKNDKENDDGNRLIICITGITTITWKLLIKASF